MNFIKPLLYVITALVALVVGALIDHRFGFSDRLLGSNFQRPLPPGMEAIEVQPPLEIDGTFGERMIKTAPIESKVVSENITINGRIATSDNNIHQISARLAGRVEQINFIEGSFVNKGSLIAKIYSPEFISAENEFLLARNTVRTLNNKSTIDLLEDAKATLESAKNKLRVLGASESDIENLNSTGIVQQHLNVYAPISGRVLKRSIDPGGYLDVGANLGTLVDMSTMWFLGNVFEADLAKLKVGQKAKIKVVGLPEGEQIVGQVNFISPSVNPMTHAITLRVDLPNGAGNLKTEMFAKAEIAVAERSLPVLPRSSVVQDGAESFVMVRAASGLFERRSVVITSANEPNLFAVTKGLIDGDMVVVDGGVLIDRSIGTAKMAKDAKDAALKEKDEESNTDKDKASNK